MDNRDEYLRYAKECVAFAQTAMDHEARARFLAMAQAWRELAEKAANQKTEKA